MRILFHWPTQHREPRGADTAALIAALRQAGHDVRLVGGGLGLLDLIRAVLPASVAPWMDVFADRLAALRLRQAWVNTAPQLIFTRAAAFHGAAGRLARATRSCLIILAPEPLSPAWRPRTGRLRGHGKAAEAALWRAADRVLTPSAPLAEALHVDGLPRQKLTVMRPGGAAPVQPPRPPADRLRLGIPADQADSPAAAVIRAAVPARANLDIKILPQPDDAQAWAATDIALLPVCGDMQPAPALRAAMAAGCAILAADTALTQELFQTGQTALLFDAGTPETASTALAGLLDQTALIPLLGRTARARLDQLCQPWDAVAAEIMAIAQADLEYRQRFAASRLS